MAESATILIPDISGYREFLTKTELVHRSHIINELLEAILKRLGERRTSVQFHAKWLCSPEPPREMTKAILADYRSGFEAIKMLCETP